MYIFIIDSLLNTSRQRQNGSYLADNSLECIIFKENLFILIQI